MYVYNDIHSLLIGSMSFIVYFYARTISCKKMHQIVIITVAQDHFHNKVNDIVKIVTCIK